MVKKIVVLALLTLGLASAPSAFAIGSWPTCDPCQPGQQR